ncbi:FABP family protein [Demequina sp. B12]|uniref:FABP family protein n=1 Tax=Demequina sp. B12 TaxID=2992757 RepID=UPI00237AEE2E|nr:FABP family protein [Demequina sp. B12]MDE0572255.1 FABP family protein [Demequina sp. B12]
MSFVIPDDLAPEIYPLAWLVGRWRGFGEIDYPGIPQAEIVQDIVFDHDGGPYLTYTCTTSLKNDDGGAGQVWSVESGFWRVAPQTPEGIELQDFQHPLEIVLTEASGVLTCYMGAVGNGRIDMATRFAAATESGPEVRGGTRMYGLVEGELMWAWDLAAFGHDLQSYMSARLARVED